MHIDDLADLMLVQTWDNLSQCMIDMCLSLTCPDSRNSWASRFTFRCSCSRCARSCPHHFLRLSGRSRHLIAVYGCISQSWLCIDMCTLRWQMCRTFPRYNAFWCILSNVLMLLKIELNGSWLVATYCPSALSRFRRTLFQASAAVGGKHRHKFLDCKTY